MAVGLRLRHQIRTDDAVGTGPVINNELLAGLLRELGCEDARRGIGAATGFKADHDTHRACRIGLRVSGAPHTQQGHDCDEAEFFHLSSAT